MQSARRCDGDDPIPSPSPNPDPNSNPNRTRTCNQEGTPKTWDVIEAEELNGQKLQGTGTAKDVMTCIKAAGKEKDFPLMCQIYRIAFEDAKCETIIQINN